jgi:gliding motility-associated-like protein
MKFFKHLTIVLAGLIASNFGLSQIIGTNAFLISETVEIGVHQQGFEGSSVTPPFPNHNRGGGGQLGFVANPAADGWANYDGDFYLPGTPENTIGLQVDGIDYQNSKAWEYDIPISGTGISNYQVVGKCKLVDWDGSIAGINIHMTYKLDTTVTYYTVDVTLTNTNPVTKSNVYFYKTFDPDNNQPIGWSFMTTNTILAQPDPFCPKALVSATQVSGWSNFVGLGAIDPNTRVSWGGFSVPSGSDIYNGTGGLTGTEGASTFCDCAISISHKVASLAAGASDNFQFLVILDESQIEEAIQSLYFINYEGAGGPEASCLYEEIPDTIDFDCTGGSIELEFEGPYLGPGYEITWYNDDTGEEVGDGPVIFVDPMGTTKYRVEAVPVGDCFETPIIKYIIVRGVGVAPEIIVTDPGPQCGEMDLGILEIIDGMDLPDTFVEFYTSPPDDIDDDTDIWPGGPIGPDEDIWILLGDPVGGCYDVFELIIEFIEVSAGEDSTGFLMCNSGLETADLNTFLVDTILIAEGGVFEEVTPTGGAFNPVTGIFDPTGVTAGDYTFRYIALGGALCVNDTSLHTITVFDQPTAGLDGDGAICNLEGLFFDLNTLLVGHDAGGVWSEVTPTGGAFNPITGILTIDGVITPGDYTFEYTVTGTAPCIDDVSEFIISIINTPASVDAGPDQSICEGESTSLIASGDPGVYVWSPSGIFDGVVFTPPLGTTTYVVTVTNDFGCVSSDSLDIVVHPLPNISFSSDNLIGCTPFETDFTILSDVELVSTDWFFGDGDVIIGSTTSSVSHTYLYGGLYDVKASVVDIYGCENSVMYSDYITVEDQPVARFSMNPPSVFTNDTEVHFSNESFFASDYIWNFGDGTEETDVMNPIHFFPDEVGDVFYPVELKAYNLSGCVDSVTLYMNVKGIILFYIPNTFTPDGDQFNETFQPVFESGFDPFDFHMVVYNRWGEIVFETYNATIGWNGTYGSGGLVQEGVYTWQIDFKELHTDKRHMHNGHVTVLK